MIDPLIVRAIGLGFAALFLMSSWHKLAIPEQFRESVRNYRLLPDLLIAPVSMALPVIELMLGVAWLSAVSPYITAYASAALLAFYACSMGINLARGRVHIGCGCGMSTTAAEQPLSAGLLTRNVVLVFAALLTTLPSSDRIIGGMDYLTLALALIATVLLYIAASQLITNRSAMASWRRDHD